MSENQGALITVCEALAMQVCVPEGWSEEQILAFAEYRNPAGTTGGWQIRRDGSAMLDGTPERVTCGDRAGFVHLVVEV